MACLTRVYMHAALTTLHAYNVIGRSIRVVHNVCCLSFDNYSISRYLVALASVTTEIHRNICQKLGWDGSLMSIVTKQSEHD